VPLGGHPVADVHIGDQRSDLRDVARELVSHDEWGLATPARPVVPFVYVYVGPTNPGAPDSYEDFIASDGRLRDLRQDESRRRILLDKCSHAARGSAVVDAWGGFRRARWLLARRSPPRVES
jgi:hypothetical protein